MVKKILIRVCFVLLVQTHIVIVSQGQHGHVTRLDGQSNYGLIKIYYRGNDFEKRIEVWKNKSDKHPIAIPLSQVYEYSLDGKLFRIVQDYKPFYDKNIYIKMQEAEVLIDGKLDLIRILLDNYNGKFFYAVFDTNGRIIAIPNGHNFIPLLEEVFSYPFINQFANPRGGKIKYHDIVKMVLIYNKVNTYASSELFNDQNLPYLQIIQLIHYCEELLNQEISILQHRPAAILGEQWTLTQQKILNNGKISEYSIQGGNLEIATNTTDVINVLSYFPKRGILKKEKIESFLKKEFSKNKSFQSHLNSYQIHFEVLGSSNEPYIQIKM